MKAFAFVSENGFEEMGKYMQIDLENTRAKKHGSSIVL
jgi:hypothetical protein